MTQTEMMARDLHHIGVTETTSIARYLINQGWRKGNQGVIVVTAPSVEPAPVTQRGLRERLTVHNG